MAVGSGVSRSTVYAIRGARVGCGEAKRVIRAVFGNENLFVTTTRALGFACHPSVVGEQHTRVRCYASGGRAVVWDWPAPNERHPVE